jgi:Fanconi anemia group M protein
MYLKDITPRIYQQHIVDNVMKKGSSLIVLPTGLGKTIIALMIIDKILEKKGKVLFLAPTKPLVEQHFATINKMMPNANVKMLTGATKKKIEILFFKQ